jgi:uroporphyrinogen decarboxylase
MNAKERMFARLNGKHVDRIPNLNIIMQLAARELGVPYSAYCQDYRLLCEGNILCAQKYHLDCVTIMSDPMKEASAFGAKVVFPHDDVPYAKTNLLENEEDLLKLKTRDPSESERMSQSVLSVEMYKRELGDDMPVIGWVEGCMAEAADLRGVNEFLMDLVSNEEFVTDLLDICLEQGIRYAKAQIEAGADIIGVGDAIASVAGPACYRKFALPYETKLLTAIREMGAKTKLHICGNVTPFLKDLPADCCDILDLDWMVPLDEAAELHGRTCALSGNYNPVTVLLQGSAQTVSEAVISCADVGGPRYMSAAGCEVPKLTPEGNLLAVYDTLCRMT